MRRRASFFILWLVLLTMVGMACMPLVHNHVHHHRGSIDASTAWQAGSQEVAAQDHAGDHHDAPVSQESDCAVCAHHDRHCLPIPLTHTQMPVQPRAPPVLSASTFVDPPPSVWPLPASRAPPVHAFFLSLGLA